MTKQISTLIISDNTKQNISILINTPRIEVRMLVTEDARGPRRNGSGAADRESVMNFLCLRLPGKISEIR